MPCYYGIGEVQTTVDGFIAVDFRRTGQFCVHQGVFRSESFTLTPSPTLGIL